MDFDGMNDNSCNAWAESYVKDCKSKSGGRNWVS